MNFKERYLADFPQGVFLEMDNRSEIEHYLSNIHFLKKGESIQEISRAGEGNMNLVLRVVTNLRSFIVKQSRPWVEKYPNIEAPSQRSQIEGSFYSMVKTNKLTGNYFPDILETDPKSGVIIIEDLGESADFMGLYQKKAKLNENELSQLITILSVLYRNFNSSKIEHRIDNTAMRQLNAEHIFDFPFRQDNALDLEKIDKGLQKIADSYKNNELLKFRLAELKKLYLAKGDFLLMGDYYPGSWLNTENGIRIIDTEFCFFGPVEFDLGVFLAHLILTGQEAFVETVMNEYYGADQINSKLSFAFAGVEILRRILGVAQLPLDMDLKEKEILLQKAAEYVVNS